MGVLLCVFTVVLNKNILIGEYYEIISGTFSVGCIWLE
jgi:hypothetical protein